MPAGLEADVEALEVTVVDMRVNAGASMGPCGDMDPEAEVRCSTNATGGPGWRGPR
jgi:hypothetical protein